jgi:hypothetical protein
MGQAALPAIHRLESEATSFPATVHNAKVNHRRSNIIFG